MKPEAEKCKYFKEHKKGKFRTRLFNFNSTEIN